MEYSKSDEPTNNKNNKVTQFNVAGECCVFRYGEIQCKN